MEIISSARRERSGRWPQDLQLAPEIDAHMTRLGVFAPSDGPIRASDSIALWRHLTDDDLPTPAAAIDAFCQTLRADSDLSALQIADIRQRLFAKSRTFSLDSFLETTRQRFERRVRPWFPIWKAYADWTLTWSAANRYRQMIFLCRDSVPFYVLVSQRRTQLLAHERNLPSVRLLHASRRLVRRAEFDLHLRRTIRPGDRTALIDTGCYGSITPELLRKLSGTGLHPDPAVVFFFSRNPLIFGYMNYLASWDLLGSGAEDSDASLLDFVIYAGDVVEALPKPYRIGGLTPDGLPAIQTPDLISFALGRWLLGALAGSESAAVTAPWEHRDAALRTSRDLSAALAREHRMSRKSPRLLFAAPAPKKPPLTHDYRGLWQIAPQEAVFGTTAG